MQVQIHNLPVENWLNKIWHKINKQIKIIWKKILFFSKQF